MSWYILIFFLYRSNLKYWPPNVVNILVARSMKIWYFGTLVLNLNVAKNLSTWKTEAGVLWIWEQPGLPSWDSVSETLIFEVLGRDYPVLFGCTNTIIQSLQMEEGIRRGEGCHVRKTCLLPVAFMKHHRWRMEVACTKWKGYSSILPLAQGDQCPTSAL